MSIEQEKLNALNQALGKIEKEFGKGSVMKLGEATSMAIDVISTGSIGLDIAVGIGGLPKGRIIEVYGPESSGKTTVALHTVAEAQKQGGIAAFIDAEHALDPAVDRLHQVELHHGIGQAGITVALLGLSGVQDLVHGAGQKLPVVEEPQGIRAFGHQDAPALRIVLVGHAVVQRFTQHPIVVVGQVQRRYFARRQEVDVDDADAANQRINGQYQRQLEMLMRHVISPVIDQLPTDARRGPAQRIGCLGAPQQHQRCPGKAAAHGKPQAVDKLRIRLRLHLRHDVRLGRIAAGIQHAGTGDGGGRQQCPIVGD